MIASLMLLIYARSTISKRMGHKDTMSARLRLVPVNVIGPMTPQVPLLHSPVNFPHPQMRVTAPSDNGIPELWSDTAGKIEATRSWRANANASLVSYQAFPPITISGVDSRQFVREWKTASEGTEKALTPSLLRRGGNLMNRVLASSLGNPRSEVAKTPEYWQDSKATALHNMYDVIAKATVFVTQKDTPTVNLCDPQLESCDFSQMSRHFMASNVEMVGLIPKVFFDSGQLRVDEAVLALGVFSREKVKDDRRGSLRKAIQKKYGRRGTRLWWARPKRPIDVFAISGLVNAPDALVERDVRTLHRHSVMVLLAKIENYARKEQKVIVVPRQAYIGSDGRDLTEYYVSLGFEMVEMKDLPPVLLYTGTCSWGTSLQGDDVCQDGCTLQGDPFSSKMTEDDKVFVQNQQVMVGMKLCMNVWTGV